MKDGEAVEFDEEYERLCKASRTTELYYASGHSTINSRGSFYLGRSGNEVYVFCPANHLWYDT